jgi:hypothetical protein
VGLPGIPTHPASRHRFHGEHSTRPWSWVNCLFVWEVGLLVPLMCVSKNRLCCNLNICVPQRFFKKLYMGVTVVPYSCPQFKTMQGPSLAPIFPSQNRPSFWRSQTLPLGIFL